MLDRLDREARDLNISKQAVIKTLLRQALDDKYAASLQLAGGDRSESVW